MDEPPSAPLSRPPTAGRLERAEARGQQVLVYTPQGPLGGSFVCWRCAACGWQPDLIEHQADCPYRRMPGAAPAPRPGG